jgi:hypothetical protein
MVFYTGLGYLVFLLSVAPLIVVGSILNWGFGIDLLKVRSWWPLHSLVLLGAVLIFAIGWYLNRKMIEDTVFEESGPVTVLRPKHTLYWIRMEYWAPIILVIYFGFVAFRYFR